MPQVSRLSCVCAGLALNPTQPADPRAWLSLVLHCWYLNWTLRGLLCSQEVLRTGVQQALGPGPEIRWGQGFPVGSS